MDFVLLAFVGLYSLKGFLKGFVAMLFSLIGVFVVVILAWKLSDSVLPWFDGLFGRQLRIVVSRLFDKEIGGEFSSPAELESAVANSKFGVLFGVFLFKMLKNIQFEPKMTAGQILSPTVSELIMKVVIFVVLFVLFMIVLKVVKIFINSIIKKCGLSSTNRIFGALVGVLKGLLIFGAFYVVCSTLSNLLLNETLLAFVQSGKISNLIYNKFIAKILQIVY